MGRALTEVHDGHVPIVRDLQLLPRHWRSHSRRRCSCCCLRCGLSSKRGRLDLLGGGHVLGVPLRIVDLHVLDGCDERGVICVVVVKVDVVLLDVDDRLAEEGERLADHWGSDLGRSRRAKGGRKPHVGQGE